MFKFLFVALNYFWLDLDPDVSASWYCDQHVFKIHSEVVESVWDAFLTLDPSLGDLADAEGLSKTYRKGRHAPYVRGKEGRSHPLSRWNTLARANAERSLINAKSIFDEHRRRTGTTHLAYKDWEFLVEILDRVPYTGPTYDAFLQRECLGSQEDRKWYVEHSKPYSDDEEFTNPPRCINSKLFPGCDDLTLVGRYRQYYQLKTRTVKAGKEVGFRYFHTLPPRWLLGTFFVKREVAGKPKTTTITRTKCGRRLLEIVHT